MDTQDIINNLQGRSNDLQKTIDDATGLKSSIDNAIEVLKGTLTTQLTALNEANATIAVLKPKADLFDTAVEQLKPILNPNTDNNATPATPAA